MRILILEDYFPLQQELVELVEDAGHQASAVSNATEGTELLIATQVDAMIIDIFVKENGKFVPDGGIIMISRVRDNLDGMLQISKDAPILAITAASVYTNDLAFLDTSTGFGANVSLKKPLDFADISNWIDSIANTD